MSRPVRIPDRLAAEVDELAELERRKFAAMVAVLIEDGLKVRRRGGHMQSVRTGTHRVEAQGIPLDAEVGKTDADYKLS